MKSLSLRVEKRNISESLDIFIKLFPLIHDDLYRYIYSMTRNKHLTEDILQETAIIGWQEFKKLKDVKKFKSWMFTIAKRETLYQLKRHSREMPLESSLCLNMIEGQNVDALVFDNIPEIMDAVIEAIYQLSPEYRSIICHVYYSQLTLIEASEILNINYNTIKTRHRRALVKIKKYLIERNLTMHAS